MSIETYNEKALFYDIYRTNCPGWEQCLNLLNVKRNDMVLDLGCGTGAFTHKLMELQPKLLYGLEPSLEMYKIAQQKLSNTPVKLLNGLLNDFTYQSKFNIIFCSQVLQNLTLDLSKCQEIRLDFFRDIYSHLSPGGQLLLTTRYFPDNLDYSIMYWYADKTIVPKSVHHMNTIIGNSIETELIEVGFTNIVTDISQDLIYNPEYYKIDLIDSEKWRSADSFWSHISRYNELDKMRNFITNLQDKKLFHKYIQERDLLRNNMGHIRIISAYKPN